VGDLSKHQYRLHVSDPMYNTMKLMLTRFYFICIIDLKKYFTENLQYALSCSCN
jgi:hypothetical protein